MEDIYQQYMYSYPHKTAYRPLCGVHLKDYLGKLAGKENSLYFHIPFCQYKCGYCNLFSAAGLGEQWMYDYVDAMERHAGQLSAALPKGAEFTDLTLGGGTPLMLPLPLLGRVFAMAQTYFGFEADGHAVVVETSPNQTTEEKLRLLKEVGVSRVSIGVQSFQEEELRTLSRFHSVDAAKKALHLLREMDFACINIDLIYGIPGQTIESLKNSLEQAVAYGPKELFVYPLYVKPGTYLYQQGAQRPQEAYEMYCYARDFLRAAGYQPYSMRRFVKGKQQKDSLCGFGNTLSVGCGGRSYIGSLHFCTPYVVGQEQCFAALAEYIEQEDFLQVTNGFVLSEDEEKRRYVIKHILFGKGILCSDYRMHYGEDVKNAFPQLSKWEQAGYAVSGDGYISLTEEGFARSDELGPQLISQVVRERSKEFYRSGSIL